jgi:hypothetical protein
MLYEDRLDGRITKAFYDEKSTTIQEQLAEVERKVTALRAAELPPLITALDILRSTSNACHAFRAQPEPEQRKLLTMMLKEAQWKEGRLHTTLLEPFELLRRSNHASSNGINGKGGAGAAFEIWLPAMGSNHKLDGFLNLRSWLNRPVRVSAYAVSGATSSGTTSLKTGGLK